MSDKTDDPGQGHHAGHSAAHGAPGDAPRRPHATLDLKATEIGREGGREAPSPQEGARERQEEQAHARPAAGDRALPPPASEALGGSRWRQAGGGVAAWIAACIATLARWLTGTTAWLFRKVGSNAHLSHAAAGVLGAALTLAVAGVLGLLAGRQTSVAPDMARRLAALEQQAQAQARQPALSAGFADKLAAADKRLSSLEEQARAIAALKAEHARLASEAKELQTRIGAPDTAERIARLETGLAALSGDGAVGGKVDTQGVARLAARLAELEKGAGEAGEAKAAGTRLERDLAALKAEAAGLRQGLAALKAEVEEAIPAKLAGIERDLHAEKRTEGERSAGTRRVLLALEVAGLKRAIERGDSYARELESAKRAAGGALDLTALDRSSATGVPPLGALVQEFKHVSAAALDAESTPAEASVLDRLMAGARSVVRVRKTQYAPEDASAEAVLARMEAALKDGNLGEALAQGKRLPPKAAAAVAGWLSRLEARFAADRAVAEVEARLKSSLAGPDLTQEPKQ